MSFFSNLKAKRAAKKAKQLYVRRMVVRWSINIVVLWVLMQISGHVR
jgi:hypothetical protein